jgi:DNA-binding transcriptional regulator YhcF (GntR family)
MGRPAAMIAGAGKNESMKKTLKYTFQPLTDHIEAMIASGYYGAGTRIPSLRILCERFQLSRGTAARGLEFLRNRGVLELRRGSGAYVRGNAGGEGRSRKIAVFSEHADPSSYCGHILLGIQRHTTDLNVLLTLNLVKYENTTYEILENAARANDALMLIGSYDGCVSRLPRIRPGVGVDMHNSLGFASLVGLDPIQTAELAADFFHRRGFKKVKIIGFPLPLYIFRSDVFTLHWTHHFGTAETFFPVEQYENFYTESMYPRIADQIADPDCGYLFVSGTECNRTLEAYHRETGKFLTDERCILSVDGKSLIVPDYFPVNTITPDYCEIGSLALQECLRRIDNPGSPPRRIMLNGTLHEIPPK